MSTGQGDQWSVIRIVARVTRNLEITRGLPRIVAAVTARPANRSIRSVIGTSVQVADWIQGPCWIF